MGKGRQAVPVKTIPDQAVIPSGDPESSRCQSGDYWIPAFAGMTEDELISPPN